MQSWGTWAEYTEQWYDNASPEDMQHVACLRVRSSFYDQLPQGHGPHFREHVAHHQYRMLHFVYQLRKEFTMPPRDNEETQPSQSVSQFVSAWYGMVKPRVCTPNRTPQVLQQQVTYEPRKQKRAKVKAPTTATREDDKEHYKILQRQDSYHPKVKALKYLEFTQDTIGHQKVTEKLSAPKIKYQTTRMMQEAQEMHRRHRKCTTMGAKVFSETGTMTVFGIGGWVSGCIIWKRPHEPYSPLPLLTSPQVMPPIHTCSYTGSDSRSPRGTQRAERVGW